MSEDKSAAENEHASRVREMFATVASRYDLLNHLLSGNMDRGWRRMAANTLRDHLPTGSVHILDVACGTGDLSFTVLDITGGQIVGTDFCRPMLEIAARKASKRDARVPFVEADALKLPFLEGSFHGVTVAFGLRNFSNAEAGMKELLRVLKPGGVVVVLEFSRPVVPGFSWLFHLYFTKIVPFAGGLISGSRRAYQYLPDSVSRFHTQRQLASIMREVGFEDVEYHNLTGGIAALHLGKRPAI